jgi:hypothetical protein
MLPFVGADIDECGAAGREHRGEFQCCPLGDLITGLSVEQIISCRGYENAQLVVDAKVGVEQPPQAMGQTIDIDLRAANGIGREREWDMCHFQAVSPLNEWCAATDTKFSMS